LAEGTGAAVAAEACQKPELSQGAEALMRAEAGVLVFGQPELVMVA